ncbi:MAG: hypothetical protein J0L55_08895 [Caulobacterales bacterium]|nr:hypothetical protein [Caulobacterales bacterium]MCA0373447.1 hypothetical protein [Pseudomonadota bacterium]
MENITKTLETFSSNNQHFLTIAVPLFIALVVSPIGFAIKKIFFEPKNNSVSKITQNQKGGNNSTNIQIGNYNEK